MRNKIEPAARRHAEGIFEMSGKMRLIRKTAGKCRFRKARTRRIISLHFCSRRMMR